MDELKGLNGVRIGFAISGSFCTFARAMKVMRTLNDLGAEITPILSYNAANHDTRFMLCEDLRAQVEAIAGRPPLITLTDVEPIGPTQLLDLLIVAPCTGNTLAKLAADISDTPVTLACKSHLRNAKPILLAISTNDGLSGAAKNIGALLNAKHYYFVPFGQDDPFGKPNSLIARMEDIPIAVKHALKGGQMQPILI